jgi:uncharacterized membrane protein
MDIDPQAFERWMMIGLISLLVAFMAFIIWDLAKRSHAGRYGTLMLFGVLGLGVLAFVIKEIVVASLA